MLETQITTLLPDWPPGTTSRKYTELASDKTERETVIIRKITTPGNSGSGMINICCLLLNGNEKTGDLSVGECADCGRLTLRTRLTPSW